jgi:putative oxidoreductase
MTTTPFPALPLVGRILMSAIFLASGAGKLAAPAGTLAMIRTAGLPLPEVSYAAATAVELLGGLLLIAGYRARLVALALAGFSVATALTFHTAFADPNQLIHFLKNLALAGGLLQVAAFGAGPLSLDARAGRG